MSMIFFFQVNTSGQFVGLAEMVGQVDFDKTVEHWQQDKWTGCFPVKWHIVKDVPNNILKHIIIENNEGKPVTNRRATQDVSVDACLLFFGSLTSHIGRTLLFYLLLFVDNSDQP